MTVPPAVSVVMPTYNRASFVVAAVQHLLQLRAPEGGFEIVVVDDGSSDDTPQVLAGIDDPRVRVVRRVNGGPAAARNSGVAASTGPLIAFTDDDCQAQDDWLLRIMEPFADPKLAAVGGRTLPLSTEDLVSGFMAHRHYQELPPRGPEGEVRWVVTCNAAFRRSALTEVGGFNESFPVPGGEDNELCARLRDAGWTLGAAEQAVVLHDHSWRSIRAFLDTWNRYGRGDALMLSLRGEPVHLAPNLRADARFCARVVRSAWRDTRAGLPAKRATAYVALDIARLVSQRAGLYREDARLRRTAAGSR
jgi:glycosyltransferase involved in cell wall biosynthesis